jgi:hypothetical protein
MNAPNMCEIDSWVIKRRCFMIEVSVKNSKEETMAYSTSLPKNYPEQMSQTKK